MIWSFHQQYSTYISQSRCDDALISLLYYQSDFAAKPDLNVYVFVRVTEERRRNSGYCQVCIWVSFTQMCKDQDSIIHTFDIKSSLKKKNVSHDFFFLNGTV